MTISSNTGKDFTVDAVVRRAFQLAGLLPLGGALDTDQADLGRFLLHSIITSPPVVRQVRLVDFYDLTLTASDGLYTMPANVVDIVGNGKYIAAGDDPDAADAETTVRQESRATWHSISAKSAEGRPNLFFFDRSTSTDQGQIRLWPVPDEAGTIRFQTQVLPADHLNGEATLDVREYWISYLVWGLAHQVAESQSLPSEKVVRLLGQARGALNWARMESNEGVDQQVEVDHPTAWSD